MRVLDVSVARRAPGRPHALPARRGLRDVAGRLRDYDGEGRLIGEVKEEPPASRFPQARWTEPQGPHARHNLGSRPSHVLRIELKR